jgi:hypothetical protein
VTGETGTYLTLADALEAIRIADQLGLPQRARSELHACAVRGVLVPEGMIVVNPDDLAIVVDFVLSGAGRGYLLPRERVPAERLRAVLAASNPTTETPVEVHLATGDDIILPREDAARARGVLQHVLRLDLPSDVRAAAEHVLAVVVGETRDDG